MVRVTVLYPNETGKRFDHAYYAKKHLPMVMERLKSSGLLRYEVDKGRRWSPGGACAIRRRLPSVLQRGSGFPEGDRRARHRDHERHS
jgi:hypothetical protein